MENRIFRVQGAKSNADPTNNALLINFRLSSDAEMHRLTIQERAKLCMQRVHIQTELPFLHATVGGWVHLLECATMWPGGHEAFESVLLSIRA